MDKYVTQGESASRFHGRLVGGNVSLELHCNYRDEPRTRYTSCVTKCFQLLKTFELSFLDKGSKALSQRSIQLGVMIPETAVEMEPDLMNRTRLPNTESH